MGTFETKFVIPDLTTDRSTLPISSVVLSNQRAGYGHGRVPRAEKDKKLIAANPLVQDNQKLVPSVTRVFSKDSGHVRLPAGLRARRPRPRSPWWPRVSFIAAR